MGAPPEGEPRTALDPALEPEPPPAPARPADPANVRFRWAAACALALAAVGVALDAHGRGARVPFEPPAELAAHRWVSVGDAGDAVRIWMASDLRGRRLLVLTGRWSRPRTLQNAPPVPGDEARASGGALMDFLDADAALWFAGTRGIARILDVVMPPEAFALRREEAAGSRAFVAEPGGFALPFDALERHFATPDGYRPSAESVLVLVEPSFFAAGAPPDVPRWLRGLGVRYELAMVALDDPAASEGQRAEARRLVEALGAPFVEAAR